MTKQVLSLTSGANPVFAWRLPAEVAAYKQQRLPAGQWINVIKGFSQKGVKAVEAADAKVEEWLKSKGNEQVSRDDLASYISFALPAIKEARFSGDDTAYAGYRWSGSLARPIGEYHESLFYFPTFTEDLGDRVAELDEAISALNFDFDVLGNDPDLVFRLDEKRTQLIKKSKAPAEDGSSIDTHFSSKLASLCPDARADFAHMRWSVISIDGVRTLFVNEFQSDWAQKGRANDWSGDYKRAPLVTETEHWTNFLLRRAMNLAIENDCKEMCWINGSAMANGGLFGSPGLDEFYFRIVPSLAKKIAKPYQSELALRDMALVNGRGEMLTKTVAVMPITQAMRESRLIRSSVYSFANVVKNATFDPVKAKVLEKSLQSRADAMLGKEKGMRVSVVREIIDAYTSKRAAGALVSRVAQVAFSAEDPIAALDHEAFHFAYKYHLSGKEREAVTRQFSSGSPLLVRTVRLLMSQQMPEAAMQAIKSPEEAAAHAFSFWRKGYMSISRMESVANPSALAGVANIINKIFPKAFDYVTSICQWMRRDSISPTDFVARIVRNYQKEVEEQSRKEPDIDAPADVNPELPASFGLR